MEVSTVAKTNQQKPFPRSQTPRYNETRTDTHCFSQKIVGMCLHLLMSPAKHNIKAKNPNCIFCRLHLWFSIKHLGYGFFHTCHCLKIKKKKQTGNICVVTLKISGLAQKHPVLLELQASALLSRQGIDNTYRIRSVTSLHTQNSVKVQLSHWQVR